MVYSKHSQRINVNLDAKIINFPSNLSKEKTEKIPLMISDFIPLSGPFHYALRHHTFSNNSLRGINNHNYDTAVIATQAAYVTLAAYALIMKLL